MLARVALLGALAIIARSAAGRTVFDAVALDSMEEIKKSLSDDPSALNTPGPGGQSPLMNAVLTGKVNAVKYLLRKKADPSIPEKDGYTPMHGAGFQGRSEIAKLLIAHGLDPSDVHKDGHPPMMRACWGREQRHTETVQVFLDAGADVKTMKACLSATPNAETRELVAKAIAMAPPRLRRRQKDEP